MKTINLILLAISISGCSARTISIQAELPPCSTFVELVKFEESHKTPFLAFAESNPEIIKILNKREDQLQARIDKLCGVIESTHR